MKRLFLIILLFAIVVPLNAQDMDRFPRGPHKRLEELKLIVGIRPSTSRIVT